MDYNLDGEQIPYDFVSESSTNKQLYWDLALGLQKIDGLIPSSYMESLIDSNIKNKIDNTAIEKLLYTYYETKDLNNPGIKSKRICDLVSNRIVKLISQPSFSIHPTALKSIHKNLFTDIYDFAGIYRTYNISKKEPILNGNTVNYALYDQIEDMLKHDFNEEKEFNHTNYSTKNLVEHITNFTSKIYEVHPFGDGNTRTVVVFVTSYLKSLGFYNINNDLFKEHSIYFRNALVRANYSNYQLGIKATNKYLMMFFENLLLNKNHKLSNKDLMISELFD